MRAGLDRTLALGGLMIVLLQAMIMTESQTQAALVVFGLMLNQAGYWGLGRRLALHRRVFLALRAEVDSFLRLVRQLNAQVLEGSANSVERTRAEMIDAIDKICMAAGVIGETIPPEKIAERRREKEAAAGGAAAQS